MEILVRPGSIDEVVAIQELVPEFDKPYSKSEYNHRLLASEHLILIAECDGEIAGFKVGYDRFLDGEMFYSWMGAVLPEPILGSIYTANGPKRPRKYSGCQRPKIWWYLLSSAMRNRFQAKRKLRCSRSHYGGRGTSCTRRSPDPSRRSPR